MNAWPARTFLMLTTAVRGTPEGIAAARTDDRHRRSLQTWLAVYRGRRPGHGRRFGALAAVPAVLGKRARKALILNPTGRPSRMKCSTFAASWHHFRPAHGMNPIDGPDKPSPPRIEQPKLIQSCPAPAGDPLEVMDRAEWRASAR